MCHDTPRDNFLASVAPDTELSAHPEGRSGVISFIIVVNVDDSCETKGVTHEYDKTKIKTLISKKTGD